MREQRERAKADARPRSPATPTCRRTARSLDAGGADDLHRLRRGRHRRRGSLGLLVDGASVPAAREGERGRARPRPHPVLRRGRRPARRPGHDPARQRRRGRGRTTSRRRCPASSCTAAGSPAARSRSATTAHGDGRRRAPPGDQPRAHRDPPGAQGVPRRARRDRDPGRLGERAGPVPVRLLRAGGACRRRVLRDVEQEVNEVLAADLDVRAEVMTQEQARDSRARWRCSARSTATRCGSSRSATGRASSAAAPTRSAPASSAWSRSSASRRSAPACAGSRRWSASTPTSFLAREHALVAQLTEALKVRPEELPERVAALTSRLREVEKDLEKVRSEPGAGRRPPSWPPTPTDVFGVGVVTHRAPDGTAADDLRRLVLDVRGRIPGERPAAVAGGRRRERPAGRGRRGQRRRAASGASRPASWCGWPPACSAAVAAARTTSPRAAAPTPRKVDEALRAGRAHRRPAGHRQRLTGRACDPACGSASTSARSGSGSRPATPPG